jgi:CHASE3 domain sensor protein
MKSRVCFPPLAVPCRPGHRSSSFSPAIRRQRRLLLGVSILLILGWTIGAIWLINVRRGERSTAEVRERQGAIAALLPAEMARSR